jgi:hypothetical protein
MMENRYKLFEAAQMFGFAWVLADMARIVGSSAVVRDEAMAASVLADEADIAGVRGTVVADDFVIDLDPLLALMYPGPEILLRSVVHATILVGKEEK